MNFSFLSLVLHARLIILLKSITLVVFCEKYKLLSSF
jgi:hypothetical protein